MSNDRGGGSFFSFFLMGGIVGAIVGLLLAPRKGQETRAELSQKSEVLKEQLNPTIDNVKEMIRDKLADSRGEVLQDVTDEENIVDDSESK